MNTNQVFVLAQGCSKTTKKHPLHFQFPFSTAKFVCKHGGTYRPHRPGIVPQQRPNQKTLKTDCPVEIKLKLVGGQLEIVSISTLHNHQVNNSLFQFYPEIRRFSREEEHLASNMLQSRVAPRTISSTINSKRLHQNKQGLTIPKDVFNLATALKNKKREGRTEEEALLDMIKTQKADNPKGSYEAHVADDENSTLKMVYIQTEEMKKNMVKYPETGFLDSTYRVNLENYCIYAVVVMDENGFGQPASVAFLSDERAETLRCFFQTFKKNNPSWEMLKTIFVDKDFTQKLVLENEFPKSKVLLCSFHVLKAVKTNIAKEALPAEIKQGLFQAFRKILYSRTEEAFKANEEDFLFACSEKLKGYYQSNWGNDPFPWCFAFRDQLRTFGNNTTNRVERFFLTLKTALKGPGNAIAKRLHLTECIEIVLDVLKNRSTSASYQDFRNCLTVEKLHNFPIPDMRKEVGDSVTGFAAQVIKGQCDLFLKENYLKEDIFEDLWYVINQRTGRKYEVQKKSQVLNCSCYVNCSFGIPCRHIFFIHESNGENKFQVSDVLKRWLRNSPSTQEDDHTNYYTPMINAALHARPDEDLAVHTHNFSQKIKPNYSKLGTRFHAIKDVTTQLCDEIAKHGAGQFSVSLENARLFLKESISGEEFCLQDILKHWKESRESTANPSAKQSANPLTNPSASPPTNLSFNPAVSTAVNNNLGDQDTYSESSLGNPETTNR